MEQQEPDEHEKHQETSTKAYGAENMFASSRSPILSPLPGEIGFGDPPGKCHNDLIEVRVVTIGKRLRDVYVSIKSRVLLSSRQFERAVVCVIAKIIASYPEISLHDANVLGDQRLKTGIRGEGKTSGNVSAFLLCTAKGSLTLFERVLLIADFTP